MGFRFQKRIRIMPGVWLNLSKSGVSLSFGAFGITHNIQITGRQRTTLALHGTGMSYRIDNHSQQERLES
jgi:hypothetical protein